MYANLLGQSSSGTLYIQGQIQILLSHANDTVRNIYVSLYICGCVIDRTTLKILHIRK